MWQKASVPPNNAKTLTFRAFAGILFENQIDVLELFKENFKFFLLSTVLIETKVQRFDLILDWKSKSDYHYWISST